MAGVTLVTALATCALIFFLKPIHALIAYFAVLVWYPSYLSAPIGTVDFTVHRIVILFLFGKLYLETKLPSRFKLVWLDKLLIVYFVAQLLAGAATTRTLGSFLENRAGRVFDMMLPYFAVRFIITDKQKYLLFLKSILVVAVPLATIGLYQCLSGHNPAGFMMRYYAWEASTGYSPMSRIGLTRANVVFSRECCVFTSDHVRPFFFDAWSDVRRAFWTREKTLVTLCDRHWVHVCWAFFLFVEWAGPIRSIRHGVSCLLSFPKNVEGRDRYDYRDVCAYRNHQ